MRIGGEPRNVKYEYSYKNFSLNYNDQEIQLLAAKLKDVPRVSLDFNQYKINLDETENRLQMMKSQQRIEYWRNTGIFTLQTLGYVALGIGLLYTFKKLGLFEFVSKCIPKSLCIRICCPNFVSNPKNEIRIEMTPSPEDHLLPPYQPSAPRVKTVRFKGPNRI